MQKITRAMASLIVKDARRSNSVGTVAGDLECDGHSVRSMHISKRNAHFRHLHPKASDKSKRAANLRKAKYFLMYLRILALRKRGSGKIYIAFGDDVLLPPRSRPPPENIEEVLRSKLLDRAAEKSVIHFDGALAWQSAIRTRYAHKKFKVRKVVHHKMEFVAKCRRVRLPNGTRSSSLTGTQCIDGSWASLSGYIPKGMPSKFKGGPVNPALYDHIFEWLWWTNHKSTCGFDACGQLVRRWRAGTL